ncbi:MAG TPA: PilZ domain-containing protein [Vicinamibacteria bacterium]|nr:PilZ domain-containing protein [Vicinamibacteria bacterium]
MPFASYVAIVDVCRGGMAIRTDRRMDIGHEYSLAIKGRREVTVKGVVAWSRVRGFRRRRSGESVTEYMAGLRFTEVIRDDVSISRLCREARRFVRYRLEGLRGSMVFASHVEILDLSLGGVAILADRRLDIGNEYSLTLERGRREVHVKGVVTWSAVSGLQRRPRGESVTEYAAGLRFDDVLGGVRSLIELLGDARSSEELRLDSLRLRIHGGQAVLGAPATYRVRFIGLSGMLIDSQWPLKLDSTHSMEIVLRPGEAPIEFAGRVASRYPPYGDWKGHYQTGIEFSEIGSEARERLEAFVAQTAGAGGGAKPKL